MLLSQVKKKSKMTKSKNMKVELNKKSCRFLCKLLFDVHFTILFLNIQKNKMEIKRNLLHTLGEH